MQGADAKATVSGEARFDLTSTLTSSDSTAGGIKCPSENGRKNTIFMRIFMNFYHNTQEKSNL